MNKANKCHEITSCKQKFCLTTALTFEGNTRLCDLIWYASSRSGVVLVAQTAIRFLIIYPHSTALVWHYAIVWCLSIIRKPFLTPIDNLWHNKRPCRICNAGRGPRGSEGHCANLPKCFLMTVVGWLVVSH